MTEQEIQDRDNGILIEEPRRRLLEAGIESEASISFLMGLTGLPLDHVFEYLVREGIKSEYLPREGEQKSREDPSGEIPEPIDHHTIGDALSRYLDNYRSPKTRFGWSDEEIQAIDDVFETLGLEMYENESDIPSTASERDFTRPNQASYGRFFDPDELYLEDFVQGYMDGEATECDEIAGVLNDIFGTDQYTKEGVSDALSKSDEFEFVSVYKFKPSDIQRSYELNAVLSDIYGDTFD